MIVDISKNPTAVEIIRYAANTIELRGLQGHSNEFDPGELTSIYTSLRVSTLVCLYVDGVAGVFEHVRDVLTLGPEVVFGVSVA